jgi:hypothetical protein
LAHSLLIHGVLAKGHARAVADGFPDALEASSCASRQALGFEDAIDRIGGELERSQSAAAQVALRVADRKILPARAQALR